MRSLALCGTLAAALVAPPGPPPRPAPVRAVLDEPKATITAQAVKPRGATKAWEVHKFGGASLATAELYRTVGDLLLDEATREEGQGVPTMAVVSAMGGMTDLLIKVVDAALDDFDLAATYLDDAVERQLATLQELAPPDVVAPIAARIRDDAADVLSVVRSLRMIKTVPAVTMEVVTGFGEIWSAQTLLAYLRTTGVACDWVDARQVLVVKSESEGLGEKGSTSTTGVAPLWTQTTERMGAWWAERSDVFDAVDYNQESCVLVCTGFVATTEAGVPTTLKRSGSDYSATIFARLLRASRVTMWKNTDGVYTADPRRVPEAFPIASLKYDEAMELAYFGAQVLHPSAMAPCIDDNIPVFVRNVFNPAFEGTVIQGRSGALTESRLWTGAITKGAARESLIKGITSVDDASLLTLEGALLADSAAGLGRRVLGALKEAGVAVLMVTQASSEASITCAVPTAQGQKALKAVEAAFELEFSRSRVNSASLLDGVSVVAIVGEGMVQSPGASATFMNALAQAGVNIAMIAQGSSERQIAVCVAKADATRALRAAHTAFTLSEVVTNVAVLGATGRLGRELLPQLKRQQASLRREHDFVVRVTAAANSERMCFSDDNLLGAEGDAAPDVAAALAAGRDFDLEVLTEFLEADLNPQRVVVDSTQSEAGRGLLRAVARGGHLHRVPVEGRRERPGRAAGARRQGRARLEQPVALRVERRRVAAHPLDDEGSAPDGRPGPLHPRLPERHDGVRAPVPRARPEDVLRRAPGGDRERLHGDRRARRFVRRGHGAQGRDPRARARHGPGVERRRGRVVPPGARGRQELRGGRPLRGRRPGPGAGGRRRGDRRAPGLRAGRRHRPALRVRDRRRRGPLPRRDHRGGRDGPPLPAEEEREPRGLHDGPVRDGAPHHQGRRRRRGARRRGHLRRSPTSHDIFGVLCVT